MTGVSAAIGVAGAVGSAVAPSLFGGSKGSTSTSGGTTNTSQQSGPALGSPYLQFENNQLSQYISPLEQQAPFSYDPNQAIAGFTPQQQTAFGAVNNAASSWQPYLGLAGNALGANTNPMYNPTSTAAGAFGNAQGTPSALSTGMPGINTGMQTAPSVINSYLNPNVANTVSAGNQLQSANFLNNVLPGLNAGFVGSGGGLGSKGNQLATNMALTNLNQNIGNTDQAALQAAYQNSMTNAQTDLSRQGNLGVSAGNLALGQQAGYGALGTQIGNNAALGNQTNLANAGAWNTLGTSYLNNGLTGANAQLQIGNQQQQQQQALDTFNYNQAQAQYNDPYAKVSWAGNVANQYNWPQQQNTQSTSTGSGSGLQTNNASPIGTGLGLATTAYGILNPPNGGNNNNNANNSTSPTGVPGGPGIYPNPTGARGGYFGLDSAGTPSFDSNPGYWPTVKMARGGYAPHGQGNFGVGSIPHMPRKGVPGDPYFSSDGGMRVGGSVHKSHGHDDDLYHRFMFGFNSGKMARGGYFADGGAVTPYQGDAHFMPYHEGSPLVTLNPHYAMPLMMHPGTGTIPGAPSVPGFDHNPGYWGDVRMAAGGFAPSVRAGRVEVSNDIRAAHAKQAALARQQAAMSKPLQFSHGGYFAS